MSKLRAIRKAAGFTQVQLSQKAGVSRFRLCMAESESLELRPDEIEAINRALEPEMERAARIASEFRSAMVQNEESSPAPMTQATSAPNQPSETANLVGEMKHKIAEDNASRVSVKESVREFQKRIKG